jgi:hypothetical protein
MRNAITAAFGACAAIAISAPAAGAAHGPAGNLDRVAPGAGITCHSDPGSALTYEQIAALAEIQQGAMDAGLYPGVFGP